MLIWTWRKIFQRVHHLISHVDIETWRRRQGLTAVSAVLLLVGAEPAAIGTPYADICSPWKSIISTMDEKSWNSLTWSPCENCVPLEEAPCSISAFHIRGKVCIPISICQREDPFDISILGHPLVEPVCGLCQWPLLCFHFSLHATLSLQHSFWTL